MNITHRFNHFFDDHAVPVLLYLGFFVQGGKEPLAFFIWGSVALLACASTLGRNFGDFSLRRYAKEIFLFLGLLLCLQFSQDASVSLYRSCQALTLLLVWCFLKSRTAWRQRAGWLYAHCACLGILTLAVTWHQYLSGEWRIAYGFFPINPIFNATWMSALGTTLLTRSRLLLTNRVESFKEERFSSPVTAWGQAVVGVLLILTTVGGPARSTVLGLVIGLAYGFSPFLSFRKVAIAFVLLLGALTALPKNVLSTRLRLNEGNYRSQIWAVDAKAFLDHPFLGWGLSNFEMAYQRHAFPVETDSIRFDRSTEFAHNEFFQIADDAGIAILLLLLWGLFCVLRAPVQDASSVKTPAKAGLIVLCTIAAYNITWHLPILLFLTLIYAATLRAGGEPNVASDAVATRPVRWGFWVIAGCLELSLGWVALRHQWSLEGEWSKILSVTSRDAEALENWALQQTDPSEALAGYRRATELAPNQASYHESFARALEATRRRANALAAIEEYKKAFALSPGRAINALSIGRNYFHLGQWNDAIEWFQTARRIEPHYWECDLWIARCYDRLGKIEHSLWTLRHLKQRREAFIAWQERSIDILPSQNLTAPYDETILAFDSRVYARELSLYTDALGAHGARPYHPTHGSGVEYQ